MKKVNAYCHVEVLCHCPYCDAFEDILDDVREDLGEDHRAENINKEITCSECGEVFIVENINF